MSGATALEHLDPCRLLIFILPNPHPVTNSSPYDSNLRFAVLDSPISTPVDSPAPKVAAMLVPVGRESDWIFSTVEGQLQLLLGSSLGLSRLILVGNPVFSSDSFPTTYIRPPMMIPEKIEALERSLLPLLLALSPKSAFDNGMPMIPFLSYEDNVVCIVPVERAVGPVAEEMVVEDVEIEIGHDTSSREVRRRLRFKRMPNLIQTQIRISPRDDDSSRDLLLQPYLVPMVAGLCLIASSLEETARTDSRPKVLCLGVGGGGLLMFLHSHLGFDVLGVESDEVVLSITKRHFGFVEGEFLRVTVGDGINMLESFNGDEPSSCSWRNLMGGWDNCIGGIDAIMVDLDSGDVGSGFNAPPTEFVQRNVLVGARSALGEKGLLVVNVIPSDGSLYLKLIGLLRNVFCEVYQIDVGNGENYVVVATVSPTASIQSEDWSSPFKKKLKNVAGQWFANSIAKI